MEHEASQAICLVSSPSFSKVSIKMCCVAFNGGAIIVDATKGLTLVEMEKIKGRNERSLQWPFYLFKVRPYTSQTNHKLTPQSLKKVIHKI